MTFEPLDNRFEDYLRDESRLSGHAAYICFPTCAAEVAAAFERATANALPVTVQGGRTGVCGGGVPQGGLVVSTARLLGFAYDETARTLTVGAGETPASVNAHARRRCRGLRFAPNPTEKTATMGGLFATAAKGGNALMHGGAAAHINGLEWVTPRGEVRRIKRGAFRFDETGCALPAGRLNCAVGLPHGGAAFLCPQTGMDLVDFLAGSEGALGAAAQLDLALSPEPRETWRTLFFFDEDAQAMAFAAYVRGAGGVAEAEFFDEASLDLLRRARADFPALASLPPLPGRAALMVTIEADEPPEAALLAQMEAFEEAGGREEAAWSAASAAEAEAFANLRHALPEAINREIDAAKLAYPRCRKFATDMAAPGDFAAYREMYRADVAASGLEGYVFGHLLDNRLHVNLIPKNDAEAAAAEALRLTWARRAAGGGGLFVGENGIGRAKLAMAKSILSAERLAQIRQILSAFGSPSSADWS